MVLALSLSACAPHVVTRPVATAPSPEVAFSVQLLEREIEVRCVVANPGGETLWVSRPGFGRFFVDVMLSPLESDDGTIPEEDERLWSDPGGIDLRSTHCPSGTQRGVPIPPGGSLVHTSRAPLEHDTDPEGGLAVWVAAQLEATVAPRVDGECFAPDALLAREARVDLFRRRR